VTSGLIGPVKVRSRAAVKKIVMAAAAPVIVNGKRFRTDLIAFEAGKASIRDAAAGSTYTASANAIMAMPAPLHDSALDRFMFPWIVELDAGFTGARGNTVLNNLHSV
jgi:hypothetical protein